MKAKALRPYWNASLIAIALTPAISLSQDFFDGDTSNPGDWNDPANWTNDVLPGAGTNPHVGSAFGGALNATANISGPLTNPSIGELRVGAGDNSVGVVNHRAGTLETNGWSFIGVDGAAGPADGTYNLSGTANLEVNGNLYLGLGGGAGNSKGHMNISDSAVLNLNGSLAAQQGALIVGANDGNKGSVTQTGGSVTYNSWMTIGESSGATGTYDMSGGALTQNSDWLTIGESNFATGTLTVSGTSAINLNANGFTLGRRVDGTGNLDIIGSTSTVLTTNLLAGIDSDSLGAAGTGNLSFTADAAGVTPILASGDVRLNDGTIIGTSTLTVDMTSAPQVDTLLIEVGGTRDGTFAAVNIIGGAYLIDYGFGDGNDIGLRFIPEPSTALLGLLGGLFLLRRRR